MKRMSFVKVVALGFLLLGFSAAAVWAGEPQTKTGTVKKVNAEAKQIVVMVLRELTFTCNDETKIMQGGQSKKIADIKVDDKVAVEYIKDGDTRTAKKIVILGDKK